MLVLLIFLQYHLHIYLQKMHENIRETKLKEEILAKTLKNLSVFRLLEDRAMLTSWMKFFMNLFNKIPVDMRVYLRCGNIGVTKHFLHSA